MDNFKEVQICSVRDNIQAEMILGALKNNGIPAIKRGIGSSDIMNVYGGNSLFGENIYVAEENEQRAAEILKEMGV